MRTPATTARQCLAPDSSSALDDAVAVAKRRQHTQTTSLHVVFSLLSPSSSAPPLLRDALSRSLSSAYSPRLQLKALDLCFSVALDRLPSSTASATAVSATSDEPPISNSLMAAIKRSQANQRRHPDTFHFYQQQQQQSSSSSSSSSSFLGVKVELQQLILAILDDPIVSRVFGEAGFRNSDIKLAVLRPPRPPILRFPRAARCPPLFLCNFADTLVEASEGLGVTNFKKIVDIMARGCNRNPMFVGVGAADAAREFAVGVEKKLLLPLELKGLRFACLEEEILRMSECGWVRERLERLLEDEESAVAVGVGDLKGLSEMGDEVVSEFVREVTRALEVYKGRLWVMGWSGNYETYMKVLSRFPTLDKDWDLQLQLITSTGKAGGGLVSRPMRFEFNCLEFKFSCWLKIVHALLSLCIEV